MLCTITCSKIYEKYAKVNFVHPKDVEDAPGFTREAVAFPSRFVGTIKEPISPDLFAKSLIPGSSVNIVWSKKLNSYVVRF